MEKIFEEEERFAVPCSCHFLQQVDGSLPAGFQGLLVRRVRPVSDRGPPLPIGLAYRELSDPEQNLIRLMGASEERTQPVRWPSTTGLSVGGGMALVYGWPYCRPPDCTSVPCRGSNWLSVVIIRIPLACAGIYNPVVSSVTVSTGQGRTTGVEAQEG
jgi:hypothetical protein